MIILHNKDKSILHGSIYLRKRDKTAHNLSEFVKQLVQDLSTCNQPVWYRGQASKTWKLIPSITRNPSPPSEMNLIKKFKQSATLLINNQPQKSIDWLFIMQHHGAPTRLLDWTESPLVAAYFAADKVVNDDLDKEGVIWALLPVELNKIANIVPSYEFDIPAFDEDQRVIASYTPESLIGEATSILSPIAINAPRINARMQFQLSTFTIIHRNITPIEEIGRKQHIWRYIIPADCKENFKKELKCISFGKFQLFPELQSIGDSLRE
jgi:hypothetical protein